jgi:uncharacterized membrane protein YesL
MAIFSYESKFSRVMMVISQSCYLNLLWFVCSIPVFTLGASTTALYDVALKIARGDDAEIGRRFFASFKSNFKQATQIWLVLLLIGIVLGTDIYVLNHLRDVATGPLAIIETIALAMVIAACIAYAIVHMYVWPLTASVENTNFQMIKNSFLIGTHYLFCTICVFSIYCAMAFLIIAFFTPLFILGVGLCAVLSSYLLNPVIRVSSYDPNRNRELTD